jgi:hypothetical protein
MEAAEREELLGAWSRALERSREWAR